MKKRNAKSSKHGIRGPVFGAGIRPRNWTTQWFHRLSVEPFCGPDFGLPCGPKTRTTKSWIFETALRSYNEDRTMCRIRSTMHMVDISHCGADVNHREHTFFVWLQSRCSCRAAHAHFYNQDAHAELHVCIFQIKMLMWSCMCVFCK